MDWRFVEDERWRDIYVALHGAGAESMQAKWDEMFGEKEEEAAEEVKVKKPRKKVVVKKKEAGETKPTRTKKSSAAAKKSTRSSVKGKDEAPAETGPDAKKRTSRKKQE
jgi:hypothetical protein